MPLATDHASGQVVTASDIDAIATAVNSNTAGLAALPGSIIGTTSGTVAEGNDSRITGALQAANNLDDVAVPATARSSLGLGTALVIKTAGVTGLVGGWIQTTDPLTSDPGVPQDGDVWINPTGS